MWPWKLYLLLGLLSSRACGQASTSAALQPSIYGAQQTAANPKSAPLRLSQQMTSDCSSFPFRVATHLYAVGSSTGADLAGALTGCLGQTACQVSVSGTTSCSVASFLHANSLSAGEQNCTSSEQSMYVCKGFAVSSELYQGVTSGSCLDDWQQQTVLCSGTQLQRSLYQAILSGGSLCLTCVFCDAPHIPPLYREDDHLAGCKVRCLVEGSGKLGSKDTAWKRSHGLVLSLMLCCREMYKAVCARGRQPASADDPGVPAMHLADAAAGRPEFRGGPQAEAGGAGLGHGQPEQLLEL